MYLSRIKLNIGERNTIKFLSSLQVAHASVAASFNVDDQTRKLWRLDYFHGYPYVLILSCNKPNLTSFMSQFGNVNEPAEIRDYQKVLDILRDGQYYRFRLCANPVYSSKRGTDERGKIVPHITVAQQEAWLKDKSETLGFSLGEYAVVQRDVKKFLRQHKYVTLSTATFEGILEIKDVSVFKNTLIKGIGRAKSYGCGLLTLGKL